jgi:predicted adenine nucleotide alpha hydrolase (AANH) superfamily ATPase
LVEPYDHKDWLEFIEGFEAEPEKGRRCLLCYRYRLAKAALVASKEGFDW